MFVGFIDSSCTRPFFGNFREARVTQRRSIIPHGPAYTTESTLEFY